MVADVTTRESPSDASRSARKRGRRSRKPAKAGSKQAAAGKTSGMPSRPAAPKRSSRVESKAAVRRTNAGARKRVGRASSVATLRKSITKAGFVRTQPLTIPARDVVTAAARLGLRMTPDYVHKVRSSTKARERTSEVMGPAPRARALAPELTAPKSLSGPRTSSEAAFRKLVLDLGLDRARRLLAEIERRLAPLLR